MCFRGHHQENEATHKKKNGGKYLQIINGVKGLVIRGTCLKNTYNSIMKRQVWVKYLNRYFHKEDLQMDEKILNVISQKNASQTHKEIPLYS